MYWSDYLTLHGMFPENWFSLSAKYSKPGQLTDLRRYRTAQPIVEKAEIGQIGEVGYLWWYASRELVFAQYEQPQFAQLRQLNRHVTGQFSLIQPEFFQLD